ncbi:MAG: AI-2E family transporter [Deltaproteobacteria bacterium]|nr:AI-2E family transporter [Deltaproteobacteria bacterium]
MMISPSTDDTLRAARRRHAIFLFVSALVFVGVIVLARSVILPFVLALVIAYVLTPAVDWVERKKVSRPLAVILVYVVVLGTLGVFIRLSAPRVVHEIVQLRRELPTISKTIKDDWVPAMQQRLRAVGLGAEKPPPEVTPLDLHPGGRDFPSERSRDRDGDGHEDPPAIVAKQRPDGSFAIEFQGPLVVHPTKAGGYTIEPQHEQKGEPFDLDRVVADAAGKSMLYAQHNALEIVKIGRDIIAGVSRFFFVFGVTLMLAAYTMLTKDRILGFFESLLRPSSRPSFRTLLARIDRGLSGVVRGQLLICLVNGVLSAIGFAIVGLKYWPVLALIATVLSLIPIFGSIVSAIPAVALGLTQSFGTAVFVLVWIVGIHQVEANLLNPKILGDAAKIHPVLVIFSLLVGEHFFGVVGALLAVPVMSITQSVFIHIRQNLQAADPEMASEPVGSLIPPPPAP